MIILAKIWFAVILLLGVIKFSDLWGGWLNLIMLIVGLVITIISLLEIAIELEKEL